mmetsp:Transcript_7303/g.11911  ORF Transcript_7303/g.11911 Transcript_7303/m.11911 type:complete len:172 (+) Transcript_7303:695-1210(+)
MLGITAALVGETDRVRERDLLGDAETTCGAATLILLRGGDFDLETTRVTADVGGTVNLCVGTLEWTTVFDLIWECIGHGVQDMLAFAVEIEGVGIAAPKDSRSGGEATTDVICEKEGDAARGMSNDPVKSVCNIREDPSVEGACAIESTRAAQSGVDNVTYSGCGVEANSS